MAENPIEAPATSEELETKEKIEKFVEESMKAHEEILATAGNLKSQMDDSKNIKPYNTQQVLQEANSYSNNGPVEEGNDILQTKLKSSKENEQTVLILMKPK